jgi:hypothetical protein
VAALAHRPTDRFWPELHSAGGNFYDALVLSVSSPPSRWVRDSSSAAHCGRIACCALEVARDLQRHRLAAHFLVRRRWPCWDCFQGRSVPSLELAGDIAFALDHIEKEERLNYLAYYDSLTDLANSTLLHERLEQYISAAGAEEEKLALVLITQECRVLVLSCASSACLS